MNKKRAITFLILFVIIQGLHFLARLPFWGEAPGEPLVRNSILAVLLAVIPAMSVMVLSASSDFLFKGLRRALTFVSWLILAAGIATAVTTPFSLARELASPHGPSVNVYIHNPLAVVLWNVESLLFILLIAVPERDDRNRTLRILTTLPFILATLFLAVFYFATVPPRYLG